jgi:oleate hydratase
MYPSDYAPDGLAARHVLTIERLAREPEPALGMTCIADHFDPDFFATKFWRMWRTTFAFQPWHGAIEFQRCLLRFDPPILDRAFSALAEFDA